MAEIGINYMWEAVKGLPYEGNVYNVLRSYYMSKCRDTAKWHLKNQQKLFGVSQMCKHCSALWCYGNFSTKIVPAKPTKHVKKNLKKIGKTKCKTLSSNKKGLVKNLAKPLINKLVMKCQICNSYTITKIKKKIVKKKIVNKNCEAKLLTNKTNKKKKDKFAGLNQSAVAAARQNLNIGKHKIGNGNFSFPNNNKMVKTSGKQSEVPSHELLFNNITSTTNVLAHSTVKIKKDRKPKVLMKVENTQNKQANKMLAIANLLKTNKNPKGPQSRLQSLLK